MKILGKLIAVFLIMCAMLAFSACGTDKKDADTRLYAPKGDSGGYEQVERLSNQDDGNGEKGEGAKSGENGEKSESDENGGSGGVKQMSLASLSNPQAGETKNENTHVGRFDLKSLKVAGEEKKDRFEYFYIQLRADDVLIAASKQKDKKEAYGVIGYKLEKQSIIFDNTLTNALKDIKIEYKGGELAVKSDSFTAMFELSDPK